MRMMNWVRQRGVVCIGRRLHSYDGPSESLKMKMAELEKMRKRKSFKKQKNQVFVEVPESLSYLDTATMPMYLAAAGIALFAKLLMMVLPSSLSALCFLKFVSFVTFDLEEFASC